MTGLIVTVFVLWILSFSMMLASCHLIDRDWNRTRQEAPEVLLIASFFTGAVVLASVGIAAAVWIAT